MFIYIINIFICSSTPFDFQFSSCSVISNIEIYELFGYLRVSAGSSFKYLGLDFRFQLFFPGLDINHNHMG